MTLIVEGTLDTLPAEVLRNLVELARCDGERLVIIDNGHDLPSAVADPQVDLLLDPAFGNWDFFADHLSHQDFARAAEAITASPDGGQFFHQVTALLVEEFLHSEAGEPAGSLDGVRQRALSLQPGQVRSWLERLELASGDEADRLSFSVLAYLVLSCSFCPYEGKRPRVSLRRWLAGTRGSILFMACGPGGRDPMIAAAIACIVELEAAAGRTVHLAGKPDETGQNIAARRALQVAGGSQWTGR
ncbi:type IV secretion system DNA-binding domain-containing protein [Sphingomonas sp. BK235]|uniref:type IV secretion system DNA-binding domain-containing protein n=1 Tax=Sphingomonas sp. BK235 TaxID=2512131 RepID=UPI00104E99B8|nr:type IV secretion system DNA-binding domain-containing protein [Sphingomonas sp. BK235]TCP32396.1 type IV secretion system coupling TraD/TrwB family protein [Sphingomonas sp. BK235]